MKNSIWHGVIENRWRHLFGIDQVKEYREKYLSVVTYSFGIFTKHHKYKYNNKRVQKLNSLYFEIETYYNIY